VAREREIEKGRRERKDIEGERLGDR